MVIYIATNNNHAPIENYSETWGKPVSRLIKSLTYEQLVNSKSLPVATYIFSDVERLLPRQAESAAQIWNQLDGSSQEIKLLNHPTLSKRRYSLLRHLYECGINQFNVYLLTEARLPKRYPVFIRKANDHKGNVTQIINSYDELQNAIQKLNHLGLSHEDAIITEFFDTADEQGLFRKYSAFLVGDQVIPRYVFFGKNWMLKRATQLDLLNKNTLEEEWEYMITNPHQQEIKKIFKLANIDYGRIDYSIWNDRLQVWEINTNPTIGAFAGPGSAGINERQRVNKLFANNFNDAIKRIDSTTQASNSKKVFIEQKANKSRARIRYKFIVHRCLKLLGLLYYEDRIYKLINAIKEKL